jgi:chromosome segregation ATPase
VPDADPRDGLAALAAREADLERREAALRLAEEERAAQNVAFALATSVQTELESRLQDVEARERELVQTRAAVESQRRQLATVQAEYEARKEALAERTREVAAERRRLHEEEARIISMRLDLERRFQQIDDPASLRQPRAPMPATERDWWSKQLGTPLEPA